MSGWGRFSRAGLPVWIRPGATDTVPERRLDPPDTFHVTQDSKDEAAERRADDALSDFGSQARRRQSWEDE